MTPPADSGATAVLDQTGVDHRSAAAAAGRLLPARGTLVAGEPALIGSPGADLPGAGSQALVVTIEEPPRGGIALIVAAELVASLQDGPLGASDVATALGGPMADAIASIEADLGTSLRAGVAEAVEADALSFEPSALVVPLRDDDDCVAALVIDLAPPVAAPAAVQPAAEFSPLVSERPAPGPNRSLDMLHDVEMGVTVELGRTRMAVRDLLSLAPGAVVELDRAAGSPVDVLVNGTLIARGEVVVIDDDFGIRITEILGLAPGR